MLKLKFTLLFVISIVICNAQENDTVLIRKTLDLFFSAMDNFDSTAISKSVTSECTLHTIFKNKEGKSRLAKTSMQQFKEIVGKPIENTKYHEELLSYSYHIDGLLASVWTPFRFTVNDKFSHCGTNYFTLIKLDGIWRIHAIIDTRYTDSETCPE